MKPSKPQYANRVLAALPQSELTRLEPQLSPVNLEQEKTLLDGEASHAYFLEDGMASAVVMLENGEIVEVGVIGFEGVVGIPILIGTDGAPGRTFMQIGGIRVPHQSAAPARRVRATRSTAAFLTEIHAGLFSTSFANRGLQPPP